MFLLQLTELTVECLLSKLLLRLELGKLGGAHLLSRAVLFLLSPSVLTLHLREHPRLAKLALLLHLLLPQLFERLVVCMVALLYCKGRLVWRIQRVLLRLVHQLRLGGGPLQYRCLWARFFCSSRCLGGWGGSLGAKHEVVVPVMVDRVTYKRVFRVLRNI